MPDATASPNTSALNIQTTDQLDTLPPPWLAEVLLIAQFWRATGLLDRLQQQVRVERGRMGRYLVADFVLVLLAYAASGEPTLQTFFAHLRPVASIVMAAWGREQAPHPATLSRFLAALDAQSLEQLHQLLFADLLAHGLQAQQCGGLFDRTGARWLVFDIDGTRACARQRAIPTSADYPKGRRRRPACAPGYTGKKRGEVVRTRLVIAQAHSGEWLGHLACPGNGSGLADLRQAGPQVCAYLLARGFAQHQGIVRLDGLYGTAGQVNTLVSQGLGMIVRYKDYRLLKLPWVMRCLAAGPTGHWRDPDTGVERHVYDAGVLTDWPPSETGACAPLRLVLTARHHPEGEKVCIGRLQQGQLWELFVTSLPQSGFTGVDVLNLYLGRGGLEVTLHHEDQQLQMDRWVSMTPHGQSFFQLLAQAVWNQRLWLGYQSTPDSQRTTVWSHSAAPVLAYAGPPAHSSTGADCPDPPPTKMTSAQQAASVPPRRTAPLSGPLPTLFSPKDFRVDAQQQVFCPAGQKLARRRRLVLDNGDQRWIFAARYDECLRCPLALECIGEALPRASCRQVAYRYCALSGRLVAEDFAHSPLPVVLPPRVLSGGSQALLWQDVPSDQLRRRWRECLRHQRVIITVQKVEPPPLSRWIERHRRAHRRLRWAECQTRNALQSMAVCWQVVLHGVPSAISAFLQSLEVPGKRVSASSG